MSESPRETELLACIIHQQDLVWVEQGFEPCIYAAAKNSGFSRWRTFCLYSASSPQGLKPDPWQFFNAGLKACSTRRE